MNLKKYLNKYRIGVREFAARCNVTEATLFHYFAGRRHLSQRTAEWIEIASDGLVTVQESRGKDDRTDPPRYKLRKRELPNLNDRCPLCQSKTTGSTPGDQKGKA